MTKSYRVDWASDKDGRPCVIFDLTREDAIRQAKALSRNNQEQSVYAIASVDGQDVGQRAYHDGRFSHQDDEF